MKKLVAILILSVVCAFSAVGFAACNSADTRNPQIVKVYNTYVAYAETNGETPLSYEEWLLSIKGENGKDGINGINGKDGVSIKSIEKTSTDGLTDTYIITYSDDTTFTFTVTNGARGEKGDKGDQGIQGEKGDKGDQGIQGEKGDKGEQGEKGADGKTAYQIWLDNGYTGTEEEFLEWLKGEKGIDGQDGQDGKDGVNGLTPVLRINAVTNFWEISYDNGKTYASLGVKATGENGKNGTNGTNGINGSNGKSAYEIWLDNGHTGTEEDFLAWLKGEKGQDGTNGVDGVSIVKIEKISTDDLIDTYTITYSDGNTFEFTITNGQRGEDGQDGQDGKDGINYINGIGFSDFSINESGELIITFTNGDTVNAGKVINDENPQGLDFYLLPNGTYAVGGGTAYYLEEIVIPSTYKGRPVTKIRGSHPEHSGAAFGPSFNCKTIIIPNSVTSIGDMAFYGCNSLTSVNIPDSVTSIGYSAFYGCNSLQYNEYKNGLYLGNENNPYIILVKAKSTDITSLTIHKDTKSIDGGCFSDCTSLTTISVEADNPNYSSQDGILYNKEKTEIIYILKSISGAVVLPNSVTSIGNYAFSGCSSLTSVTIPNSVKSIGSCAFYCCSSLTSITIPNSVKSIGDMAFSYCSSLTSITIPNSVKSIGSCAFYCCSSLTSITIPNSVKSIGDMAFSYCSSLTSIRFNGTKAQWQAISKGDGWKSSVPATVVRCSNGDINI